MTGRTAAVPSGHLPSEWPSMGRVAHLLLELVGDTGAEEDLTPRSTGEVAALRDAGLERAPVVLRRVPAHDLVGRSEAHGDDRPRLGQEAVRGERSIDAVYLLELVQLGHRQDRGLSIGCPDLDARPEVLHPTVDQGVEVLGHGAHRRQREYADDDPQDGQRASQLVPSQVPNDLHCPLHSGAGSAVTHTNAPRTRPGRRRCQVGP
jgi:hypothetical protein